MRTKLGRISILVWTHSLVRSSHIILGSCSIFCETRLVRVGWTSSTLWGWRTSFGALWFAASFLCVNCYIPRHPSFTRARVTPVSVNVLDFCCLLFWHHTSCSNSILCCILFHVSPLMFYPPFPLCVCVSVHVPVTVAVRARVCMPLPHLPCCCGAPEEEGRPRRRRTPRFLLKPWTGADRPQKVGGACR